MGRDVENRREWQRRRRAIPEIREERNRQQRERAAKPENKEKRRIWAAANRDRLREQARQRRNADRGKIEAQRRARYVANGGALARHRMDSAGWGRMWEAQDGRCYLCGDPMVPEDAVIEHDHSCCGEFTSCPACRRGLAHQRCNRLIGHADEDPERLMHIARALEVAKRAVAERRAAAQHEQLELAIASDWLTAEKKLGL